MLVNVCFLFFSLRFTCEPLLFFFLFFCLNICLNLWTFNLKKAMHCLTFVYLAFFIRISVALPESESSQFFSLEWISSLSLSLSLSLSNSQPLLFQYYIIVHDLCAPDAKSFLFSTATKDSWLEIHNASSTSPSLLLSLSFPIFLSPLSFISPLTHFLSLSSPPSFSLPFKFCFLNVIPLKMEKKWLVRKLSTFFSKEFNIFF